MVYTGHILRLNIYEYNYKFFFHVNSETFCIQLRISFSSLWINHGIGHDLFYSTSKKKKKNRTTIFASSLVCIKHYHLRMVTVFFNYMVIFCLFTLIFFSMHFYLFSCVFQYILKWRKLYIVRKKSSTLLTFFFTFSNRSYNLLLQYNTFESFFFVPIPINIEL